MIDFNVSINDPERDRRIIREGFFRVLCAKDRDANKNGKSNVFSIEEIWEESLKANSLDVVETEVRGFSMEEDPEVEFVENISSGRIRLTNRGRNRCEGL